MNNLQAAERTAELSKTTLFQYPIHRTQFDGVKYTMTITVNRLLLMQFSATFLDGATVTKQVFSFSDSIFVRYRYRLAV
jgi:hypothetical protein